MTLKSCSAIAFHDAFAQFLRDPYSFTLKLCWVPLIVGEGIGMDTLGVNVDVYDGGTGCNSTTKVIF